MSAEHGQTTTQPGGHGRGYAPFPLPITGLGSGPTPPRLEEPGGEPVGAQAG